jgi:hypothetical protein
MTQAKAMPNETFKVGLTYNHHLQSSRQFYSTGHSLIPTSVVYRKSSFETSDIALISSTKLKLLNNQKALPICLLFISIVIDDTS